MEVDMGAWGIGLFEDDMACDTRDMYYGLLRDGVPPKKATTQLLGEMEEELDDDEDGPVIILALAAAQWDAGRLDERIKRRALKLLAKGVDPRWEQTEYRDQRAKVLDGLKTKLLSHPPPPRDISELEP
jgi:hypothetical protein